MSSTAALKGKLVVVTGATSGIGAACVSALLACEAEVVGLGRDPAKLAAARASRGASFRTVCADLADPMARKRALQELEGMPRAVDVLINNAAECIYESPLRLPSAQLARLFEVNVTAALELAQGLAARMQPGAQILQVSSVVAQHLPGPKYAPYAASKVALDCLTEALRLELHPRGIRVSSIAPGLVDTPIYDGLRQFDRAKAKIRETIPAWLAPEDVAEAIVWMLARPSHTVVSQLTLLPSAQAR